MINDKLFDHRPVDELFAIVKDDLSEINAEGFIDEGKLIKTVMYCNEKLGIPIRELHEIAIPVRDGIAKLPLNFERLYYVTALECHTEKIVIDRDPFDNNFDADIIWEAKLDRESLGCVDNYRVVIQKQHTTHVHNYKTWVGLTVTNDSSAFLHKLSPNKRTLGKYQVRIKDGQIETPFTSGTLYIMYLGTMMDREGNILFPFHPMITPYYEWMLKEKILTDMMFNMERLDVIRVLKEEAKQERKLAWLDAYNITMEPGYGQWQKSQHRREQEYWDKYFKYLQ